MQTSQVTLVLTRCKSRHPPQTPILHSMITLTREKLNQLHSSPGTPTGPPADAPTLLPSCSNYPQHSIYSHLTNNTRHESDPHPSHPNHHRPLLPGRILCTVCLREPHSCLRGAPLQTRDHIVSSCPIFETQRHLLREVSHDMATPFILGTN